MNYRFPITILAALAISSTGARGNTKETNPLDSIASVERKELNFPTRNLDSIQVEEFFEKNGGRESFMKYCMLEHLAHNLGEDTLLLKKIHDNYLSCVVPINCVQDIPDSATRSYKDQIETFLSQVSSDPNYVIFNFHVFDNTETNKRTLNRIVSLKYNVDKLNNMIWLYTEELLVPIYERPFPKK